MGRKRREGLKYIYKWGDARRSMVTDEEGWGSAGLRVLLDIMARI